MNTVNLHYGKNGLKLNISPSWDAHIIRKPKMPVMDNCVKVLTEFFNNPVGCESLSEGAEFCETACIAICDITRPVPHSIILPPLIKNLIDAGLEPSNITILIATGLHRQNEGEELREVVGDDWILENCNVVNHFALNDEDHEDLGETARGIRIKIDKRFTEADLRIVVGLVEPHFMAGYSGGRKLITPGLASAETITRIHSAEFIEDAWCANCILEGNPIHNEQMEIAKLLDPVYCINVVIDEDRQISFINFGDIEESHKQAVDFIKEFAVVKVGKKFKTVVTTSAGYPLDKTYYQTIKGLIAAKDILEDGGTMIIASECSEGIGSDYFKESQKKLLKLGKDEFLKSLEAKENAEIDEWQSEKLLEILRKGKIMLYSTELSDEDKKLTAIEIINNLQEEIEAQLKASGDYSLAIIPEGPYVIPVG